MVNMILAGPPGAFEIILIIIVVLLLFGGKKIPELMKGLGEGMREFKKATREGNEPSKNSNDSHSIDADKK